MAWGIPFFLLVAIVADSIVPLQSLAHLRASRGQPQWVAHRVAWLHIEKCGSGFGTTLAHYANSSLPSEAHIKNCRVETCFFAHAFRELTLEYPVDIYFRDLLWMKSGNWGDHTAITHGAWSEFGDSFFAMFRELVPWTKSMFEYFEPQGNESLTQFAERNAGHFTYMLTGNTSKVDLALERLQHFRFIGFTDEWRTSICLFHLKFSTPCQANELVNTRPTATWKRHFKPGVKNISEREFIQVVERVKNPDTPVVMRAKAIFESEVKQYGVTEERCAKVCPPDREVRTT